MSRGGAALVLIATPIGNLGDLAPRAVEELRDAEVVACEDTRRARKLLSHAEVHAGGRLVAVHEHNEAGMAADLADRVRRGARVAYLADAGMPVVSDPGERLVRACADAGLPVEVVPGPSAALAALAVSGLPAERFVFEGFLPAKGRRRRERLAALTGEERTAVLFESPHRLARTLRDLEEAVGADRPASVSRELTKRFEETWRGRLGDAAEALGADPRGEYVVVLGPQARGPGGASGAGARGEVGDDALRSALEAAMDGGASTRDAAAGVARDLGVPKRRAYDLAVAVRDGRRDRCSQGEPESGEPGDPGKPAERAEREEREERS